MDNRKVIYLDDAINTMRQHSHYDDFDKCVIDESVAMKALKDLTPAEPERMRGKWVEIQDDIFAPIVVCSNCGQTAMVEDCEYQRTRYCPNCGADMRGGEDESD